MCLSLKFKDKNKISVLAMQSNRPLNGFRGQVRELMSSCIYSNLAYNDQATIKDRMKKMKMRSIHLTKYYDGNLLCKRDAQAFMFSIDNTACKKTIFAFRGTMSRGDIFDALDIRKSLFEEAGSKIHRGFHQQFKSLEPLLTPDIETLFDLRLDKTHEIHFVGHSMGGAVAAIAASYYSLNKPVESDATIVCHTFGNPHFADEALSDTVKTKVDEHICVQATDDIIPFIPIYPDFKHLPNILEIDAHGIPSCMYDCDLSYAHFLKKLLNAGNVPAIYKHHSCVEYYNLLLHLYKRLAILEALYNLKSL